MTASPARSSSQRGPRVCAESWPEEQERLEAEAKQWFEDFDPDTNGWRYWTEWRDVVRPDRSDIERGEELAKEHGWD